VLTISLSIYPKETHADVVVNVIPFENQVVKGSMLDVNVTVFEDGVPVGNARVKLTFSQLSTEFEVSSSMFAKLQPGVYKTTFNTSSLAIGMWSLTSEVQARGDTHYGQSSVTIIESPKRQTSENVVFLIIAAAGICIGAVGLAYVSAIELFGSRKKKKKRKRK
jgi:hypothetical protein